MSAHPRPHGKSTEAAAILEAENRKWPEQLRALNGHELAAVAFAPGDPPSRVWRSNKFLVMLFSAPAPALGRLSVLRTRLAANGKRWADNITWDELQRLKHEAGFGHMCAAELFPQNAHVINVANIRHLWLLPEMPEYGWKKT